MKHKVTFIVPLLNEQEGIPELYKNLLMAESYLKQKELGIELVFVDNCSSDQTVRKLQELVFSKNFTASIFSLNRNYGLQRSILFGMTKASGDCLVVFQSDLQDPIEIVMQMVDRWKNGSKVVAGVSNKRSEKKITLLTSGLFYKTINFFTDIHIVSWFQDFFLLDRSIYRDMGRRINYYEFLRGRLVEEYGVADFIYYQREARKTGKSNFNFASRYTVAMDGITRYGTKVIRRLLIFAASFSTFSIIMVAVNLVLRFLNQDAFLGDLFNWLYVFILSCVILLLSLSLEFLSRILKLSSNVNTEIYYSEVRNGS
jgi:glycosyltransferase involved in cell wall biosynthesis